MIDFIHVLGCLFLPENYLSFCIRSLSVCVIVEFSREQYKDFTFTASFFPFELLFDALK